ncbi:MAG: hypothetical protein ACRENI_02760 [Gemmatimonadaceae bacterium]
MPDESIVAEVRQCRAKLLATAGGTLDTLVQYLQERERQAGRTPVQLPPQAPTTQSRAG